MPTQVRIIRVSLSSSQVPDDQQHLGLQHRMSQVLLLQLQPQLLSPLLVVLLLLLFFKGRYKALRSSSSIDAALHMSPLFTPCPVES